MEDPIITQSGSADSQPPATGTTTPPPGAGAGGGAAAQTTTPAAGGGFKSAFGNIYHSILDKVGGSVDHHYTVDPKSGKMQDEPTPRKPGSQFAHIVTAALAGVAASSDVHGPQAGVSAFGRGIAGGEASVTKPDEVQRQRAQQDFQRGQQVDEATLRKARDAREQQESVLKAQQYANEFRKSDYDFDKLKAHDQQEIVDRWNNRTQAGIQPLIIEGKPVPEFDTLKEANDFAMDPKNTKAIMGGFQTRIDIDPNTHKFVVGQVPAEKQQWEFTMPDGKKAHFFGTPNDYLGIMNKQAELRHTDAQIKEANLRIGDLAIGLKDKRQLDQASTNWRKSLQASGNDVEKAKSYLKEKYPEDAAYLQSQEIAMLGKKEGDRIFSEDAQRDPFGVKIGTDANGRTLDRKEYDASQKTFNKDYIEPLNKLQKTNMEFQRINNNPNQTGAEKVTALLNAVGISGDPLKGQGFRVSGEIISEHAKARSIWDGAVQKLNTIAGTGGPITSKQIADYTSVAEGVVHDAYVMAAQESRRQGLPVDFLPKATAKDQVVDKMTAKIYLDIAGGNVDAAHKALLAAGYK